MNTQYSGLWETHKIPQIGGKKKKKKAFAESAEKFGIQGWPI